MKRIGCGTVETRIAFVFTLTVLYLSSGLGTAAHAGCKDKVSGLFNGLASWYGERFHGRRTASGKIYDQDKFTCAHRTLPFGTSILVVNPDNGKECTVVVTDRGPHSRNRVIDLSKAAARKLGIVGVGKVVCKTGIFASDAVKGTVKTTVAKVADVVTPGSKDATNVSVAATKVPAEAGKVPAEAGKVPVAAAKVPVEAAQVPVETAKASATLSTKN
jgi:rare lipoprotein A